MARLLLFAGTTEGRELAELAKELGISTVACVATEYGESLIDGGGSLKVRMGRLDKEGMKALIEAEKPALVLDATHPYAKDASATIAAACKDCGAKLGRVLREEESHEGCTEFASLEELAAFLDKTEGTVFSSLGTKEAAQLAKVKGAAERIWLRVLPSVDGLKTCLDAGFPAKHIICMQGPFSADLNEAMFRSCGADILLTKDTGSAGGFPEKLEAARRCGMQVFVIKRPIELGGESLSCWKETLRAGKL